MDAAQARTVRTARHDQVTRPRRATTADRERQAARFRQKEQRLRARGVVDVGSHERRRGVLTAAVGGARMALCVTADWRSCESGKRSVGAGHL
jgi:hypothetical protein